MELSSELGETKSVRLSNGCFEGEFGAWVGLGVELSNLAEIAGVTWGIAGCGCNRVRQKGCLDSQLLPRVLAFTWVLAGLNH